MIFKISCGLTLSLLLAGCTRTYDTTTHHTIYSQYPTSANSKQSLQSTTQIQQSFIQQNINQKLQILHQEDLAKKRDAYYKKLDLEQAIRHEKQKLQEASYQRQTLNAKIKHEASVRALQLQLQNEEKRNFQEAQHRLEKERELKRSLINIKREMEDSRRRQQEQQRRTEERDLQQAVENSYQTNAQEDSRCLMEQEQQRRTEERDLQQAIENSYRTNTQEDNRRLMEQEQQRRTEERDLQQAIENSYRTNTQEDNRRLMEQEQQRREEEKDLQRTILDSYQTKNQRDIAFKSQEEQDLEQAIKNSLDTEVQDNKRRQQVSPEAPLANQSFEHQFMIAGDKITVYQNKKKAETGTNATRSELSPYLQREMQLNQSQADAILDAMDIE